MGFSGGSAASGLVTLMLLSQLQDFKEESVKAVGAPYRPARGGGTVTWKSPSVARARSGYNEGGIRAQVVERRSRGL